MSLSLVKIAFEQIKSTTIAQIISPTISSALPLPCTLTDDALIIAEQAAPLLVDSSRTNWQLKSEGTEHELVIFAELTFAQLKEISQDCQLTIHQLYAINQRNQLTSYRFSISCIEITQARAALANLSLEQGYEAAILTDAPSLSSPGILVMDMDSTTIKIECIDEIAALAGVGEQVAQVTELAMEGKLDFAQSLHQRVATLQGAPESILAQVARDIPLMEGLENLIAQLKQHQWKVVVASGGFTYFAEHLQQLLALDNTRANILEIIDGKLTGKVLGEVVDAQAKANCLIELQQQYQLAANQTVAMGDGANDLVMMNAAKLGVAFHAKPIVLKQADCAINHSGLDCLLHWLA